MDFSEDVAHCFLSAYGRRIEMKCYQNRRNPLTLLAQSLSVWNLGKVI
jgi:hypothetical protein